MKTASSSTYWLIFGLIVALFLLVINIHLWSKPKTQNIEKSGETILIEVGMGTTDPKKLKLTSTQIIEIATLIIKNPSNYNASQKALLKRKTGQDILTEVGMGISDPKKVNLTPTQINEIKELLRLNPKNYNDNQKSLLIFK